MKPIEIPDTYLLIHAGPTTFTLPNAKQNFFLPEKETTIMIIIGSIKESS